MIPVLNVLLLWPNIDHYSGSPRSVLGESDGLKYWQVLIQNIF